MASIAGVTDAVADIAAAGEQSAGLAQISQAVARIDDVTQQNAALVEQATAASRAMHEQADELQQQVAFFRVGNQAGEGTGPGSRRVDAWLASPDPAWV